MPEIRGNLRDLGAATMTGQHPRVYFTPTNAGVTPSGTVISTEPVMVEPDTNGDFVVNLVPTLNLLPRTQMTVSVDWIVGENSRTPWMDLQIRLDVGEAAGSISDLVQASATPFAGLIAYGTTPPPNPERWPWWIDTSSYPPALKRRRD